MVLAQLGHKAFGGIAFAIIFVRAIVVHNRLGHERNHGPLVRMDDRCAQHLMRIGDRTVAVDPCVNRRHSEWSGRKNTPCHQGPRE